MTTRQGKDEPQPLRNGPIPIVGIGASAGGIGALETLVPLLEPGAGLAYVVVQHLDPDRESVLSALLARTARLSVIKIADQATIQADHVYVIPPNAALAISDNRLQISAPLEQRYQRTPIDGFFISLAEANGEAGRHHPVGHRQRRYARPARDQGARRAHRGAGRCRI